MKSEREHLPALDGLRGIAVLAVMAFHTGWLSGGFLGVDLFFVLSGFLITSLLLRESEVFGRVDLRRFYLRRAFRLLPGLMVFLLCIALWPRHPASTWGGIVGSLSYGMNWVIVLWGQGVVLPVPHTWSLSIEEQFYVVWPLSLSILLTRRVTPRRVAIGLAALLAVLVLWRDLSFSGGWVRAYFGSDTHADGLILGCLLAMVAPAVTTVPRRLRSLSVAAAATLLAALFAAASITEGGTYYAAIPLTELAAGVLIVSVSSQARGAAVLGTPLLAFVGRLSYSLYLWHVPIFWGLDLIHRPLPLQVAGWLCAIVPAVVSYYAVERPVRRFGARLTRRQDPVPQPAPDAAQPVTSVAG